MNYFNEELEELKEKISRKTRFVRLLENLKLQQNQLKRKVAELEAVKNKEQTDVDKLEGKSLAAFFYAIRGKKEEVLETERKEAYLAAMKFDAATKELQAVEEDISDCEAKLNEIAENEIRYNMLLAEKGEIIKSSNSEISAEIAELETEIEELKRHEKELNEALEAGKRAKNMAESIYQTLSKADDWSTWDILGGGLISDIAKHDNLDAAQRQIEILQVLLRRFQTELSDVKISANLNVRIDGFLGFADFFFDGLFADLTVKDKIEDSLIAIQSLETNIKTVIIKLENDLKTTQNKYKNAQNRINEIVLKA